MVWSKNVREWHHSPVPPKTPSWTNKKQTSNISIYTPTKSKLQIYQYIHQQKANFKYINSRHSNIQFTIEKEHEHTLSFLDVLIDNKQEIIITKVFRKNTFTGLFTNFFSFTSFSYKGLVLTLINRAFKINSTWAGFHEELVKLKEIVLKKLVSAPCSG